MPLKDSCDPMKNSQVAVRNLRAKGEPIQITSTKKLDLSPRLLFFGKEARRYGSYLQFFLEKSNDSKMADLNYAGLPKPGSFPNIIWRILSSAGYAYTS